MKACNLLIRADANVAIGTGHVMRCLALAEAWQDAGGQAFLAAAEIPPALELRLESAGVPVFHVKAAAGTENDAEVTLSYALQVNASWIVVDGDRFSGEYVASLARKELRIVLIDDFAVRSMFPANLIVNPNPGADVEAYLRRNPSAEVLSGSRYVLLRREFQGTRERSFPEHGKRILITLGGSDPEELTPRIATALAKFPDLEITAVAGAGYSNASGLKALMPGNLEVIVDSQNIASLMQKADIAVIAAGGTLWELLSAGCAVLSYSRNAALSRIVRELARDGIVEDMGVTDDYDSENLCWAVKNLAESVSARKRMAELGRKLIDARGGARVVEAMQCYGAG